MKINFRKVLRGIVDVSKVIVTLGLVKPKTVVGQAAEVVTEIQETLQEKGKSDENPKR